MSFIAKDGNGTNFILASHIDSGNAIHYPAQMLPNRPMISQFCDSLGTGLGTINIIADYSGAATDFWIEPPAGEIWHILRIMVKISDSGNFRPEWYGANGPLTNGLKIIHEVNSVDNDLTGQLPIRNIGEMAAYMFDIKLHDFGAGDKFITGRWSFSRSGVALALNGDTNDKLIVRVNDDMSGLTGHKFIAQGHKLVGS